MTIFLKAQTAAQYKQEIKSVRAAWEEERAARTGVEQSMASMQEQELESECRHLKGQHEAIVMQMRSVARALNDSRCQGQSGPLSGLRMSNCMMVDANCLISSWMTLQVSVQCWENGVSSLMAVTRLCLGCRFCGIPPVQAHWTIPQVVHGFSSQARLTNA
eukprot:1609974-Amphidinium_carterae.1